MSVQAVRKEKAAAFFTLDKAPGPCAVAAGRGGGCDCMCRGGEKRKGGQRAPQSGRPRGAEASPPRDRGGEATGRGRLQRGPGVLGDCETAGRVARHLAKQPDPIEKYRATNRAMIVSVYRSFSGAIIARSNKIEQKKKFIFILYLYFYYK